MKGKKTKHALAVLRRALGNLTQEAMADLLEVSPSTIQSIETGRLKLSKQLAARVEFETGAVSRWLLEGDISKPIPFIGAPHPTGSDLIAESHRNRARGPEPGDAVRFWTEIGFLISVMASAVNKRKLRLFIFRLQQAIDEFESCFGVDDALEEELSMAVDRACFNVVFPRRGGPPLPFPKPVPGMIRSACFLPDGRRGHFIPKEAPLNIKALSEAVFKILKQKDKPK